LSFAQVCSVRLEVILLRGAIVVPSIGPIHGKDFVLGNHSNNIRLALWLASYPVFVFNRARILTYLYRLVGVSTNTLASQVHGKLKASAAQEGNCARKSMSWREGRPLSAIELRQCLFVLILGKKSRGAPMFDE